MKRSIAIVYVAGLFLLGIVIGALGMHLVNMHAFDRSLGKPPVHDLPGPGGSIGRGVHFDMVAEQLELTGEQRETVKEILDDSWRQAEGLHEEMLPHVRELWTGPASVSTRCSRRSNGNGWPAWRRAIAVAWSVCFWGTARAITGLGAGGGDRRKDAAASKTAAGAVQSVETGRSSSLYSIPRITICTKLPVPLRICLTV